MKQINVDIVQVLRTDSEVLARIKEDFHALLRRRIEAGKRRIDITCFYEELPLPGVGEVSIAATFLKPIPPHLSQLFSARTRPLSAALLTGLT